MPVNIIQKVRLLLNPAIAITIMKTKTPPTRKPTRVFPIFCRVFPHKLRYHSFSKTSLAAFSTHSQLTNLRSFSTHSRSHSKSLIEDEAELSDWVSKLRSDSFLANTSKSNNLDSDTDDHRATRKGDLLGKRRRDAADSHDFSGSSTRGNRDSFHSRNNGRSGGQFDRKREYASNDYDMPSRGPSGSLSSRGRGGSIYGSRESRDFDSDDYGRGAGSNRGKGSRHLNNDDYGRGGPSKRGRGGCRDSFDLASRDSKSGIRGGRGSELGSRGGRGGGRGGMRTSSSISKRGGLMMSDTDDFDEDEDEDEDANEGLEKVRSSFQELISEESSQDDSESVNDVEDDDEASENASSFSRMKMEDSPSASPTNSQGGSDSYLSETR